MLGEKQKSSPGKAAAAPLVAAVRTLRRKGEKREKKQAGRVQQAAIADVSPLLSSESGLRTYFSIIGMSFYLLFAAGYHDLNTVARATLILFPPSVSVQTPGKKDGVLFRLPVFFGHTGGSFKLYKIKLG